MKLLREYIRLLLIEKRWADLEAPKGQIIDLEREDFEGDEPEGVRNLNDEIFDLFFGP